MLVANESRFDEGYDSDGQIGPFFGALDAEGDQLFEESPLVMPPTNTLNTVDATDKTDTEEDRDNSTVAADPAAAPEEGLKEKQQLKIFQSATTTLTWLKTELKLRCQPTSGKKHVLTGRLHSAINKKLPRYSTLEEAKKKAKLLNF